MRIHFDIEVSGDRMTSDYRRHFIHILKEAFKGTEFEDLVLSEDRIPKPYTFSVGFAKVESVDSDFVKFSGPMYFDFSTPIPTMISHLYNHVIKMTGKKLAGLEVSKVSVNLPPERTVKSDRVLFKTVGFTVLPGDGDDIQEAIVSSTKWRLEVAAKYHPFEIPRPNSADLLEVLSHSLRKSLVKHYGGFVEAFRGYIEVSGPPEILNFLLQAGIGIRTGQGFGMVKVVREWKS